MQSKFFRPSKMLNHVFNASIFQKKYPVFRELKYFKWTIILFFISICLSALFEGFGLGFLLAFLQELTDPSSEPIRSGISFIDVWVLRVTAPPDERLVRVLCLMFLTTAIRAFFTFGGDYFGRLAEGKLADRLRKSIFEQLQAFSISYFSGKRSGDLLNALTSEIQRMMQIISSVGFLLSQTLVLIIYFVSMLLLNWQISAVSILAFGILTFGLNTLNQKAKRASFAVSKSGDLFTSRSAELIQGMRTIHAFSTEDFERRRYYASSETILQAWKNVARYVSLIRPLAEVISTAILVVMIAVSYFSELMRVSALLTFFFVLFRALPTLKQIQGGIGHLYSMQGTVSNINNLLRSNDKIYFKDGNLEFEGLQSRIEFKAVYFSYFPEEPILKNISFKIEKGTNTALVGASGAGKSTLADLIARFHDPTSGRILIDGIDERRFKVHSLRSKMAIVSQDTFIFNASVRENIAYGLESATDSEVEEAAYNANALSFIQELPDEFNTILGDRGVRLSGGQRQRLAIARALLRKPQILILDEATSALDSISEKLIQDALERLSAGRTVITIAHRLSTIAGADQVIVLDKGEIVEVGTFNELINYKGEFWKYYQIQQAKA